MMRKQSLISVLSISSDEGKESKAQWLAAVKKDLGDIPTENMEATSDNDIEIQKITDTDYKYDGRLHSVAQVRDEMYDTNVIKIENVDQNDNFDPTDSFVSEVQPNSTLIEQPACSSFSFCLKNHPGINDMYEHLRKQNCCVKNNASPVSTISKNRLSSQETVQGFKSDQISESYMPETPVNESDTISNLTSIAGASFTSISQSPSAQAQTKGPESLILQNIFNSQDTEQGDIFNQLDKTYMSVTTLGELGTISNSPSMADTSFTCISQNPSAQAQTKDPVSSILQHRFISHETEQGDISDQLNKIYISLTSDGESGTISNSPSIEDASFTTISQNPSAQAQTKDPVSSILENRLSTEENGQGDIYHQIRESYVNLMTVVESGTLTNSPSTAEAPFISIFQNPSSPRQTKVLGNVESCYFTSRQDQIEKILGENSKCSPRTSDMTRIFKNSDRNNSYPCELQYSRKSSTAEEDRLLENSSDDETST